jgi:hypothetical protein
MVGEDYGMEGFLPLFYGLATEGTWMRRVKTMVQ